MCIKESEYTIQYNGLEGWIKYFFVNKTQYSTRTVQILLRWNLCSNIPNITHQTKSNQAIIKVIEVIHLHVSELVSDGEGSTEAVILDDGAAVVVAHGSQLCQPESVAVLVVQEGVPADVLP